MAITLGHLTDSDTSEGYAEASVRLLDDVLKELNSIRMSLSLFSGLTGVGWALSYLDGRVMDFDGEDPAVAIDQLLLENLGRWTEPLVFDLIGGLVGFGVYALERLPRPDAEESLTYILKKLAASSIELDEGLSWFTGPRWLSSDARLRHPEGYYDLGMAHGAAGVIGFLADVVAAGIEKETALPLLEGAVSWLLSQKITSNESSTFPSLVALNSGPVPARSAWCYGDPGIAISLVRAALVTGNLEWKSQGVDIGLQAARRPLQETGIRDGGLCHGAAGLGHIFGRLFQMTQQKAFKEAATFWFEKTLHLRQDGQGIAGFSVWRALSEHSYGWTSDPGFLTGAAGIALALHSAYSLVDPEWDRVLLTSLPRSV